MGHCETKHNSISYVLSEYALDSNYQVMRFFDCLLPPLVCRPLELSIHKQTTKKYILRAMRRGALLRYFILFISCHPLPGMRLASRSHARLRARAALVPHLSPMRYASHAAGCISSNSNSHFSGSPTWAPTEDRCWDGPPREGR
jgi:hypothetical protein